MFQKLLKALEKGKGISVVGGRAHVAMQEPVWRARLDPGCP
jgi:hypothetical protein